MSIGICRVQKIGSPKDIAGIQIHNRREREHSNTNPDIDRTRSAENYTIIVFPDGKKFQVRSNRNSEIQNTVRSYNALIDERIKAGYTGKKAIRKDAVRCCEMLFTASGDFFNQHPDEVESFFVVCTMFAAKRFGADNIIAATVHMDEDTPHMHLDFVPLTSDGRLSAKSVLGGRKDMQQLQDDFYEQVGKRFGLERGSRADLDDPDADHPRKHLTTRELKAATAAQLSDQQRLIQKQTQKLEQMQTKEQQLAANNLREKQYYDELSQQQAEAYRKAREASDQQRQAETETESLRQEIATLLEQRDALTAELQEMLTLKVMATKKHKIGSLFGGDTVTCDKSEYEETVAVCKAVKEKLLSAWSMQNAAEKLNKQLDERVKQVDSWHLQAEQQKQALDDMMLEYRQKRREQDQLIEQRAAELAEKRIRAILGTMPDDRRERLEQFCRGLRTSSGKSVLESFEEREKLLQERLDNLGGRSRR